MSGGGWAPGHQEPTRTSGTYQCSCLATFTQGVGDESRSL